MITLDDYRRFYADEIRVSANLRSPALVEVFAHVPREKFLGPPPWLFVLPEQIMLAHAGVGSTIRAETEDPRDVYHNVLIALDPAHDINNGQPSLLARWIEALDLKPGDRVYHLGCGVGYYTAIMAEMVGPGGAVIGIDVNSELAGRARANLAGYPNVTVHAGDGAAFDPGDCDAMLINAGVTHPHRPWLERLREGGRLALPITVAASPTAGQGLIVRFTRDGNGFSAQVITFVGIISCTSVRDPQLEAVIAKALANRTLFKIKSVRLDVHEPTDTCILHGSEVCVSSANLTPGSPTPES
jgi:protein-L-isoaspartate(D-aspartate) O-methyltransferase